MVISRKEAIYNQCVLLLNQKISVLQVEIKSIQADANKESKSSAGDKYETGRAMAQLQKDNASRQLVELLKLKKVLDELVIKFHDVIQHGSLVFTDSLIFFVSILHHLKFAIVERALTQTKNTIKNYMSHIAKMYNN